MKNLFLGFLALAFLSLGAHAIVDEIQQDIKFTPKDLNSGFTIDLNFDAAYNVSVQSYEGPSGQKSLCNVYPSQLTSKVIWTDTLKVGTSYDNVVYYTHNNKGYYFALDSDSWRVLVATDLADSSTYHYIEVANTVNHQSGSKQAPFLVIAEAENVLFILRNDLGASYMLGPFFDALADSTKMIPKISYKLSTYSVKAKNDYAVIKTAKYYNKNIHLIADNNELEIWRVDMTNRDHAELTYDATDSTASFFDALAVDITNMAFKGIYGYFLDEIGGIHVVDISNHLTYVNKPDSKLSIQDARLIEITGNSLNVISISRRNTTLHEYIIDTTTTPYKLAWNRDVLLRDAVRASFSDGNFLYLLSGFENLVAKHSILNTTISTDKIIGNYTNYWELQDFSGIVATTGSFKSNVTVILKNQVTIYEFSETKATLQCNAGNYKPGTYTYKVQSLQRMCKAHPSVTTEPCQVRQNVNIIIPKEVIQVSTPESGKGGMIAGIIIAILIVIGLVAAYWYFRLRKKETGPTVRNDVFFRRLSRSPLNGDSSNLYKVTMEMERSGEKKEEHDDKINGMRKHSDDFNAGQRHNKSDENDVDSPKRPAVVRGKTFSELDRPKNKADGPRISTATNLEGGYNKNYEGEI